MLLFSCGGGSSVKSEDVVQQEESPVKQEPMQYTINIDENFVYPIRTENGYESGAKVRVFECTENGDKIYQNDFVVLAGSTKTFTAQSQTHKIKVYLSFCSILDPRKEFNGWLPLVYYLSPNDNKEISIDYFVNLSNSEP